MGPRFFIDRPVFAWVVALLISLGGLLALMSLPIEQYPSVAPPSLTITATYPGADAATVEQTVTQVIEQELNGVEGLLYMSGSSSSNGQSTITATFESGTDIDIAQMNVQNRLTLVEQRLPEEVRRQGIPVRQANSGFLLLIAISSKTGATADQELGNFASSRVVDELRRVNGVGDVQLFSSPYAMRVWLDPERLASFRMSSAEALAAVQEQNSQSPGGQLGDLPLAGGTELNAAIVTQGRFNTPEQFRRIILRANTDGSTVTLGDVARVELGALSYAASAELNGKPVAVMAVQTTTGANAINTAEGVRARMAELEKSFPQDIAWSVPYDTTPFISASIGEVVRTLAEAMLLVFLVMFLFLQNWRATLIPTIIVPIALAGACMGLFLMGFTINVLSLFAMVLAIGILVDDAIVVIENVERIMAEEHLPPREATIKAMGQITSAIVGITLVLMAVFVPMSFFPGSTGGIYRQFAVTLIVSIGFSALLALSLTPALCATFLKPHKPKAEGETQSLPERFFGKFNRWFERVTHGYQGVVGKMLGKSLRWLLVFLLMVGLTGFLFTRLPGGFLPNEDQGVLFTAIQAPAGATVGRTDEAIRQVSEHFAQMPEVQSQVVVRGFSFFGQGQANGMVFSTLTPWGERSGKASNALTLMEQANMAFFGIKQAMVFALSPPAIPELGNSSGFAFKLKDVGGMGPDALLGARNQLLGAAAQSPVLMGVRPEGQENAPQLKVTIDRVKARALGLSIGDVNGTLAIAFGSAYANDFTYDGRILRVMLQAEAPFRMTPRDVLALKVRNASGEMVPFGSFTTVEWVTGPQQLDRYNGYPAMTISGSAAPGKASGDAMAEMERLAQSLPEGFSYEWTGTSFEEQQAGGQIGALLGLSFLIVFLLLAALYESWSIPVAVLLVVPLGVLGAVLLTMARGLSADVYFNVGLIAIIGLAAKNAILIVEFAIEEEDAGKSPLEATLNAVKLRLRPIIMTSLAFIGGMIPLFIASGAGAASRVAVGTGVIGGMLAATLLGIFFTPLFYLSIRHWLNKDKPVHEPHVDTVPVTTAEWLNTEWPAPGAHPPAEGERPDDGQPGKSNPRDGGPDAQ
ncbi:multidrug efflux RND transporter permease subunit [Sandaracinobacter sp. RS1-74]|uniref:efflux RND transporter permease subunit n=1 Tax=Sandaracinobacteroides sayramensis TaxID=2913411 RepID=UPI001EDC0BEE|nr:efflux RND transporter permease subunit [Sandaracinobacteroides sayramensis]MCG2841453.1 multidrug efflux RND transporter permease subunit [Sandaracinobacteroides sayramensis]